MSGAYGDLVLCLGDWHSLAHRAELVHEFKKMMVPNKMLYVLSPGNLTSRRELDFLKTIAPHVRVAKGDLDDDDLDLESATVQKIGEFKVGITHGHDLFENCKDSLYEKAIELEDCDLLIFGGTHELAIFEHRGKWFVNPGSVTGAPKTNKRSVVPSFLCMSFQGDRIVNYAYSWSASEGVKVDKSTITKK